MARINAQRIARAFFNLPDKAPATDVAKVLALLTHPSQPGRGMAINADAYDSQTEQGRDICVVSFEHDPHALNQAEVQKRRAELDAA